MGIVGSFRKSLRAVLAGTRAPLLKNRGYCPTCARETTFAARDAWLRDHYLCTRCGSLPRERALMAVLEAHFPAWRAMSVHESSPGRRGASMRLARECPGYVPSQYFPDKEPGCVWRRMRCENLEALTFPDESIDLHVTQDVLEHVFHPSRVFAEIARTLRPGGGHVFTVPLVRKEKPSARRARLGAGGQVEHLEPPTYHGNPIDRKGSLVTMDWGYDICRHVFESSGLYTQVVTIDDLSKGIRAEYVDVLVTRKPAAGESGGMR